MIGDCLVFQKFQPELKTKAKPSLNYLFVYALIVFMWSQILLHNPHIVYTTVYTTETLSSLEYFQVGMTTEKLFFHLSVAPF